MSYEQVVMICMGLTFIGVVAAIVISYKAVLSMVMQNNKDLMATVDEFTLAGMTLFGSDKVGHPMAGPATLQQLAKMREASKQGTDLPDGEVIEKNQQPRAGVTITQKQGV